jgi:8-oxo-dGTP diphosphatase
VIHVVVGLLFNAQGEILVAQRDQHKFQGGRWEFPGGKVELEETPIQALKRELYEEVGIDIIDAEPWQKLQHEYPERTILLDIWKVKEFHGQPHGKEGQSVRWVLPHELTKLEIPDANWEIVEKILS